jgi:hypothetical protein
MSICPILIPLSFRAFSRRLQSRLLVAWLLFLSLTFVGWAVALSELIGAFALTSSGAAHHDATLAATIGTVVACAVITAHFKHRALCWAATVLWYGCCCGRIITDADVAAATAATAEAPAAVPAAVPAPGVALPALPGGGSGAAAADLTAQLPV